MRTVPPARAIDTLIRPATIVRGEDGRPLKAAPALNLRLVGVAGQSELAPSGSSTGNYWFVSPLQTNDDLDFQVLHGRLQAGKLVGMGVVVGSQPGCGAMLLVPLEKGFALHALNSRASRGPFEELFSQRLVTLFVANWADPRTGFPFKKRATSPANDEASAQIFGVRRVFSTWQAMSHLKAADKRLRPFLTTTYSET